MSKGFEVVRNFDVFRAEVANISFSENQIKFETKKVDKPDWKLFKTFWDIYPSWQNSIDSVKRTIDDFEIFAAFDKEKCIGYLILETNTGDVPQLSIHKDYRRKGIGSSLIKKAIENRARGFQTICSKY